MPDYTPKLDSPPVTAGRGPATSHMIENMWIARDEHPGEWVRIATYPTRGSADSVASDLRTFKRTKRRPPGNFEFQSGAVADSDTFGVWARYIPDVE